VYRLERTERSQIGLGVSKIDFYLRVAEMGVSRHYRLNVL